jgi:hypothetical protein
MLEACVNVDAFNNRESDISFLRDGLNLNVLLLDRPYITEAFSDITNQASEQDQLVVHVSTLVSPC